MGSDTASSRTAKLRHACLDLLEAEYQLRQRRRQQQREDYTSSSDADIEWNRYAIRIRRYGGYALAALIMYAVMLIANLGGVIKDVSVVVLLIAGLPTAYNLVRLLLTLPMRAKAAADERRMAKKWSSFDKAEASCNTQRQRLAQSMPASEGKRFVHIPPVGAEPEPAGRHAGGLTLAGGINFTERDGKNYVDGMLDMQPCSAEQVLAFIEDEDSVNFHFDRTYLRNHPEETYYVGLISSFSHEAKLKSHTTAYNQIDVNATMANYDSAFDRAERKVSASGRTHQEDYDAGRMSFGAYRDMEDFKESEMEREREALEKENARNTWNFYYYDEVTQSVYTVGYAVMTSGQRLICAGYYRTSRDVMHFTYRLPKYVRVSNGAGLPDEAANALKGELLSFSEREGFELKGKRRVMDFVLRRFGKKRSAFNPLQKQPANMEDDDFRYWIELQYFYSRDKR